MTDVLEKRRGAEVMEQEHKKKKKQPCYTKSSQLKTDSAICVTMKIRKHLSLLLICAFVLWLLIFSIKMKLEKLPSFASWVRFCFIQKPINNESTEVKIPTTITEASEESR